MRNLPRVLLQPPDSRLLLGAVLHAVPRERGRCGAAGLPAVQGALALAAPGGRGAEAGAHRGTRAAGPERGRAAARVRVHSHARARSRRPAHAPTRQHAAHSPPRGLSSTSRSGTPRAARRLRWTRRPARQRPMAARGRCARRAPSRPRRAAAQTAAACAASHSRRTTVRAPQAAARSHRRSSRRSSRRRHPGSSSSPRPSSAPLDSRLSARCGCGAARGSGARARSTGRVRCAEYSWRWLRSASALPSTVAAAAWAPGLLSPEARRTCARAPPQRGRSARARGPSPVGSAQTRRRVSSPRRRRREAAACSRRTRATDDGSRRQLRLLRAC